MLILGVLFLLNSKINITGAFIGISDISSTFSSIFGIVLVIVSILLLINRGSLEDKVRIKSVLQKRGGEYCIVNKNTGENYSLGKIKELVNKDPDYKKLLRNEFFSDLLKLYSESMPEDKGKYKQFIVALSPKTPQGLLEEKLKHYSEIFNKYKNELNYHNPARIEEAKDSDFSNELYARFEDEKRDTVWPEEGKIDFMPFHKQVIPPRGPLYSIIPLKKLIKDRYLNKDLILNGKWSKQKRQDYLRDNFGIDVGSRNRNMILFKIEKDAKLIPYNKYVNVEVKGKVPLVKIIKKK